MIRPPDWGSLGQAGIAEQRPRLRWRRAAFLDLVEGHEGTELSLGIRHSRDSEAR